MDKIILRSSMQKVHKEIELLGEAGGRRGDLRRHPLPKFVVTGIDGVKYDFSLIVSPNTLTCDDFVGLTVACSRPVETIFEVSFRDRKRNIQAGTSGFIHKKKQWRKQRFGDKSLLLHTCSKNMLVKCSLDLMFPGPDVISNLDEGVSVEDDWRQKLLAMAEAGRRTDLVLVSNDGQRFECHKLVLASRSSMFNDMIENTIEAAKGGANAELLIGEMNRDVLAKFLQYLYTGKVDLSGHTMDLFAAAHKYDLPRLVDLTGRALAASLTANNVIDVFVLFDRHNCAKKNFAIAAVHFAAKHIDEVMATEAATSSPDAANRLMLAAVRKLKKFI